MDWAPTYLFEVQNAAISTAAFKAMIIPIAGSVGAIYAGWMSDRFFKSKRAPIAAIMLFFLAIFCWFYPKLPADDWFIGLIFLAIIGFMTYGPHVLMVTIIKMIAILMHIKNHVLSLTNLFKVILYIAEVYSLIKPTLELHAILIFYFYIKFLIFYFYISIIYFFFHIFKFKSLILFQKFILLYLLIQFHF